MQDLLLLMTDQNGHPISGAVDTVLAGAALGDLARFGRITVDPRTRIQIISAASGGDVLLDRCLAGFVGWQGKAAKRAIPAVGKGLAEATYDVLERVGVVRGEPGGFLRRARHVIVQPSIRDQLVARVTAVLGGTMTPDVRTGPLIGLLQAGRVLPQVVDPGRLGLSRRQLDSRAADLAAGDWATGATREAIKAAQDATMAAITAATAATMAATTAVT